MPKAEFVMLANEFNPERHGYLSWMVSEKLDGMRALWDGGVTRGMPCSEVPYANTAKHDRYVATRVATGLWTRYAQPIYAPSYFIDSLPKWCPLDGELTLGRGQFQDTMSVCKSLEASSKWGDVRYCVFDVPSYSQIYANRKINNTFFKRELWAISTWALQRGVPSELLHKIEQPFYKSYAYLMSGGFANEYVTVLHQKGLPSSQEQAKAIIENRLEEVTSLGGEGIMLRDSTSYWRAERSHSLLKIKKLSDCEATILDFKWADLTDLDRSLTGMNTSKLRGLMGAMRLRLDSGVEFDLGCGFTEHERRTTDPSQYIPGMMIPPDVSCEMFKRGDRITLRYREMTKDGKPKEARYWRK